MIQTSIQYLFNIFIILINTVRFSLINTVRLTVLIIYFNLNNYSLLINCIGIKVLIFFLFFLIIFYILSTLYLTYLIIKRKVQTNKIKYESIIKNSEFIQFKIKLFNLYYSTVIILFIYLFRNNLLSLDTIYNNIYFYILLFILTFVLISDSFIKFIFIFYLNIKTCIHSLNSLNLEHFKFNVKSSLIPVKFTSHQIRNFSTSAFNFNDHYENDPELKANRLELIKNKPEDKIKTLKAFKKAYGGGFLGYTHIYNFGNINQFTSYSSQLELESCLSSLESKLIDYVSIIPETETYSILPVLRWEYSGGSYRSLTISDSIKIIRNINTNLLAKQVLNDINNMLHKYNLIEGDLELYLMGRPWLSVDEFDLDRYFDKDNLASHFDAVIEKKLASHSKSLTEKNSYNKISGLKNYLYKNVYMDNYGDQVLDKNNDLIGYKLQNNSYISVKTYYNNENLLCNKVSIRDFDVNNLTFKPYILREWIDTKNESGFIREFKNKKYFYNINNELINVESVYSYPSFPLIKTTLHKDHRIGTIDFETYGENLGLGYHNVYAGGFATKDHTQLFYKTSRETSEQLINRIFKSIIINKNLNGYTFYAHNLGRFDSVFILKSLILDSDIEITPIWKDESILSLTLKYGDFKINIFDSLLLIPGSLSNILKSFNCEIKKGNFPYSFVNKNNLYYIGDKPSKDFYVNISEVEYQAIPKDNWNLKKNTLLYLQSDLEGLLEVLIKFGENIFLKYQLNITNYKTLPGLAFAAYLSSYLPENLKSELKIVKGELETEIRKAYFGGNVDVFVNEVTNAFLYDLNSQYPAAMLNDMPVGNPILSLETDLDKIFGFVYGEIICPDDNILQVPFIQYKDPISKLTVCPRGKFKRLIFSQEIKYALNYGYTMDIEYCYQFKRGKDLFTKYVLEHYEIKKNSSDQVKKSNAKLFLNSLYGRFGMKDIENFMRIVDQTEAEFLDKNTNVSIISELTDNKYFIKYKGKINDSLRKIYKKDPYISVEGKMIHYNKTNLRESGLNKPKSVPSAVHIAAAIASYARIIINEYKNIPGNPCIMSDTDSAILPYPLPSHLVGTGLGQMKLVCKIKHGIFIKKKTYYIKNFNNQEIIKSSGIDSSRLDYNSFIKLLKGETIVIERTNFNVDWDGFKINVVNSNITVHGLQGNIKTIYNTKDYNFKFISFPIKYNIIVHPKFPITPIYPKPIKINKNKTSKFTHLEIFIYFIFILSYFTLIILFLYHLN